ncbi:hypothetical protein AMTRI_Chr08g161230 [Amborella trichopoda]|uniref:Bulb-type lectin domain-containing protein n=1 Tax=Amborella trichopoda TaxID=13333 RepID=W1PJA7_AMBTC|nr:mannose-specific lectin [Amborella trichopoda]ERN08088.1 hypothetical protein AMTR_s00012p00266350 [Amborella trichopoda]|eukprot:XP_006846413.1 mannose-specific lectin [Amborella trichopoda]
MATTPCFLLLLTLFLSLLLPSLADSDNARCLANPNGKNTLFSGCRLNTGESLNEGDYGLVMQGDCNLVRYRASRPIWASQTYNRGRHCYCILQTDGDMAVFNENGVRVWRSGSSRGEGDYVFVLRSDGEGAIYSAIWYMGTNHVLTHLPSTLVLPNDEE